MADLDALSAAVDRVLMRSQALIHQVDDRRAVAIAGLERLETLSPESQEQWIDRLETLDRRIVCEMLIDRCRDSRHQDATLHLRLAELAVRAAEGLQESDRSEWIARGWIELANARRISGDLLAAEQGLTQAEAVATDAESISAAVEADLEAYRAALAHDRRRYEEAIRRYEQARVAYRALEDDSAEIGVLIAMGVVQSRWKKAEDGIPHLEEALSRLDTEQPDLMRIALLNLAYLHLDAGDPQAAARYVEQAAPLFDESAPRLDRLRFEWNQGRLQRDLGQLEDAAATLERIRHSYAEENLPYEVALTALDLAAVYALMGERGRLKRLAGETVDIFRALGIAQESIMALSLVAQAEASEALELVAELSGALERRHPRHGLPVSFGR